MDADPSSPFSLSNLTGNTDTTVYLTPSEEDTVHVNDTKYAKHPGLVYDNPRIQKIHEVISKQVEEMMLLSEQVEVWIILTIPQIEDGDNFGVQVQEKVLDQILIADKSATIFRSAALDHHLDHARICSKLCKYPNVKDYARALEEHDKRQIYIARERLREIRNEYAILVDVIQKNISKIRVPKANHGGDYSS
ncbi:proteasome activator subunit 3 [Laccaria bicolor S238N-H82]|uniref:Proteasome activator subunit 3 n=1 Tax=Laccaria bicolor (strain S238N-H82 / ATCC MYA-4686) TaxID=486041 RepID=B0DHI1_LACBS|nr:proteasome activator subunit 3 [Laccaria bicolor S238N-H82]EDR06025.1 proteasome activator subunit 3 [Laccaria bicolor S238N-H82]|eukprot:XP_001883313.1 proteasome activator subunit 3 [Laccaria bicolor S238N-H82]